MRKVLCISYSGAFGGAERILLDFAGALEGEVVLACPEGPLASAAAAAGMRVLPLRERSLRLRGGARTAARAAAGLIGHGIEARRRVTDLDPDLVVLWGMRSALAGLLGPQRWASPTVFQHNDVLPGTAVATAVRRAARRAHAVLTLSRTIAEDLDPSAHLEERISICPPGVRVDEFPQADPAGALPRQALLLGALVPWKRPDLALEAVALARRELPDLRLRVVGAGFAEDGDALEQRLRVRAAREDLAGAVEFAGAVTDPRPELARAGCLLHCASREPFGLVVLEALASGRPAVAPRAGGPAEVIDSDCGRLYAPGDAAAAGAALVEVLGQPGLAVRLGTAGRERVRRRFSSEGCRRRWAQAVERVARPVRPAPAAPSSLAIVTVTHNSAPQLQQLLISLERHLPGVEVVVVDSGSSDDSLAVARAGGADRIIDLGRNAGFGTGCNAGLAAARAPVTALLNPDVEVLDDSLLALVAEALRAPDRLLAPLVIDGRGEREDSVHPRPATPADLARSVLPVTVLPALLSGPVAPWHARRPRRVGWAVGCALVAPTETLRALGPFDERIFLYGEDLDLGLRAAQAGVETWFWPAGRVLHHRGHTSERAFGAEPFELLARMRRQTVQRRMGARRAQLDDAAQAATFASRVLAKRMLGRPVARERSQLRALRAARRSMA